MLQDEKKKNILRDSTSDDRQEGCFTVKSRKNAKNVPQKQPRQEEEKCKQSTHTYLVRALARWRYQCTNAIKLEDNFLSDTELANDETQKSSSLAGRQTTVGVRRKTNYARAKNKKFLVPLFGILQLCGETPPESTTNTPSSGQRAPAFSLPAQSP